ncbi:phosphoribosylaminoimidazolesuccinocarboxamide synthase [Isachenkonia alkalipeptolytica]|uniref:Phosphoribosylaminoimidazole-succinocarboxamide synthase n=1 Tax=Isachenkonia alkalipeptolytica TaxID=2565777 RepID=A0AA43XIT9_9CLOT|nr:phosphoribosylaminoimidazolesuccinocarboxamide synthase [Isachenkonia alkalipeptolytica]NBG87271.1 phosphoribosylaminoimidazolesuccinocarboxamide synthase [Isachenkonia alkalipeptolytica]
MKLTYHGKTKDVYRFPDGNFLLHFKDDMTGADGVFDPGSNEVGLTVEGAGRAGLALTKFFFEKLKEKGIRTHYIDADLEQATMTVKPAEVFGKGLEVICRYRGVGSFLRRYGAYIEEGAPLEGFVEVTLKDDQRGDPPISKDALAMLGLLSKEEYETLKQLTIEIGQVIKEELEKKDLELYDIKFEFGRDKTTGEIILIDEISGGNMRVYQGDQPVEPLALEKIMIKE